MEMEGTELLAIRSSKEAEQPFRWSAGKYASRFLVELRDNKRLVGVRCPKCRKVYVPPKEICDPCFCVMTEPVEVSTQGVIRTYTILRFSFVDPETGLEKPVPYAYGNVQLDGADTVLSHYIEYEDEAQLKIGARVQAIFQEKRKGNMRDIKCFLVIG